MKGAILVFLLVSLCVVAGVSAFSVTSVTTDPAGGLVPNGPITVTTVLPCSGVGVYDQIVVTTDLVEPVWDARRTVQGNESPIISAFANGKTLTIPGAAFNLNRGSTGSVRVVLKGYVPETPTPGQDVIRIRQLDAEGIAYAYPSGYNLPMAGADVTPTTITPRATTPRPTANSSSFGELASAQPTEPSFGELIGARPTDRSFGDLVGATTGSTPVPTRKGTLAVPTPWTGTPAPTTEAPASPLVVLAAAGIGLCVLRR